MRDHFYNFGIRHSQLSLILASLLILGVCLLNTWLFNVLFDRSYLNWYIHAGPIFALVTTVVALVWKGLEKELGFISRNPYEYIGAHFQLAGLVMYTLAAAFDSKNYAPRPSNWDYLPGFLSLGLLFVITIGWLILIVPLQYFVFLFCGGVSRMSVHSTKRVVAWFSGPSGKYLNVEERPLDEKIPAGGWVVMMTDAPLKLTAAFSTAFLFLLGQPLNF